MNKEILTKAIDKEALRELCMRYDVYAGYYPESPYEGRSLYSFFVNKVEGIEEEIDFESWNIQREELFAEEGEDE